MQPNRGEESALTVAIIGMMLAVLCVGIAVVAWAVPPEVVEGVPSIGAVVPLYGSLMSFGLVLYHLIIIAARRPLPPRYKVHVSATYMSIMAIVICLMAVWLVIHASNMDAAASAKCIPLTRWPAFGNLAFSGGLLACATVSLAMMMYARAIRPPQPATTPNPAAPSPVAPPDAHA